VPERFGNGEILLLNAGTAGYRRRPRQSPSTRLSRSTRRVSILEQEHLPTSSVTAVASTSPVWSVSASMGQLSSHDGHQGALPAMVHAGHRFAPRGVCANSMRQFTGPAFEKSGLAAPTQLPPSARRLQSSRSGLERKIASLSSPGLTLASWVGRGGVTPQHNQKAITRLGGYRRHGGRREAYLR